jgi:hypothetical protein
MGGAVFGESDNFVGEGGIITVITKLSNGNEWFSGDSRKYIGLVRSQRKWRECTIGWEKGAVSGSEVGSIGETDAEPVRNGVELIARSGGGEKMAGAARVSNHMGGRG